MFACIHLRNEPHDGATAPSLVAFAYSFSPRVEKTSPQTAVLDIEGCDQLFGPPAMMAGRMAQRAAALGLDVNIAVAPDPEAAVYAARGMDGVTIMEPGDEQRVLGRLPVEALDPPEEILDTLKAWGIRTFGELAALPEEALSERLGQAGVRLRRLALGESGRPLVPLDPEPGFEKAAELDHALALLEPLAFVLASLINQLCRALEYHALAANELRLQLSLEQGEHERVLRLPFPMCDHRVFLKLAQLDLERHPPGRAVLAVRVSATAVKPRVLQDGLFQPRAPEPQKLELTLSRIANLVGEDNVGAAELLDTHRAGAFRMKKFTPLADSPRARGAEAREAPSRTGRLGFRAFRPPVPAAVEQARGRPARVAAHGVRGRVVSAAGPWRSSGDWWTADVWARDEWDVALSDGALYRLFRDHRNDLWFVEGSYD